MAQEIGIVKIVTGTVTALAADGSKRILQVGDSVYPTDLLTTADGSTVMIQLANGSLVDMGGNDSMQLSAALAEQNQLSAAAAQNTPPAGPSAEEIQAALLAGADPTAIAEATAAGAPAAGGAPGAGNEGHVPVTVEYLNPVAPVTNGFDTTGPSIAFTPIVPEVLILNPRQGAVISANLAPIAENDSSLGNTPGSIVTINVLNNDRDPDGSLNPASVQILGPDGAAIGPGQPLVVTGEGTWSINATTGAITFTPEAGFQGNPTPITYTVADNLGLTSNPATVSIGYIPVVTVSNVIVDESQTASPLPTESGVLRINGHAPTSVVLSSDGATWHTDTQTLTANDGSYQVTVSNDTYTFTLQKALTHTNSAGPESGSAPIDFTFSATLTDHNGGIANTTFTANVFDDGPTVTNSNGQIQDIVGGQPLSGLIAYDLGFDGFGAVRLENLNGPLMSRSDEVTIKIFHSTDSRLDEIYAFVDKGNETNSLADLAGDRMVFSLLPTVDGPAGDYKLTLYDVLDMPAPTAVTLNFDNASSVSAGQIAVGNSLLVEGTNLVLSPTHHIGVSDGALDRGEAITFKFGSVVNAVQLNEFNVDQSGPDRFTWTAYKDGDVVGSRSNVVAPASGGLTPAINVAGGYDTLKIEVSAGKFEIGGLKYTPPGAQNLQLNFGFVATDGDGDSVSSHFTVDTGALLNTHITNVLPELQHPDSVVVH